MYYIFFSPRRHMTNVAREIEGKQYMTVCDALRDARDAILADEAHDLREAYVWDSHANFQSGVKRAIFGGIKTW